MSLVVFTGPARSGKSRAAERLAAARGKPVVVAVAMSAPDEEMARRIAAHQRRRPRDFETLEVGSGPSWVSSVPDDAVLLVECLGTLVGRIVAEEAGEAPLATAEQEAVVLERVGELLEALAGRSGDTIVVTNEVGWGVVPASAAGRLFRDALGSANRDLVRRADRAWLAVAGKLVDIGGAPEEAEWD